MVFWTKFPLRRNNVALELWPQPTLASSFLRVSPTSAVLGEPKIHCWRLACYPLSHPQTYCRTASPPSRTTAPPSRSRPPSWYLHWSPSQVTSQSKHWTPGRRSHQQPRVSQEAANMTLGRSKEPRGSTNICIFVQTLEPQRDSCNRILGTALTLYYRDWCNKSFGQAELCRWTCVTSQGQTVWLNWWMDISTKEICTSYI